MMRRYFLTGLALLLPVVITVLVVMFVVNFLTKPFVGTVEGLLDQFDVLDQPFLWMTAREMLHYSSRILILIIIVAFTILIGTMGRLLFIHYFFKWGDALMHKIPIVNRIYKALQDVVRTLLASDKPNFNTVVLAPFPYDQAYSVGLITNGSHETDSINPDLVSVFIPAAPNPMMGFMLMFPKSQLVYLDMKVEEAVKIIVSCGVMMPEVRRLPHG